MFQEFIVSSKQIKWEYVLFFKDFHIFVCQTVMIKLWMTLRKLHEAQMLGLTCENKFGFHPNMNV